MIAPAPQNAWKLPLTYQRRAPGQALQQVRSRVQSFKEGVRHASGLGLQGRDPEAISRPQVLIGHLRDALELLSPAQ